MAATPAPPASGTAAEAAQGAVSGAGPRVGEAPASGGGRAGGSGFGEVRVRVLACLHQKRQRHPRGAPALTPPWAAVSSGHEKRAPSGQRPESAH